MPFYLVYVSTTTIPFGTEDLDRLLRHCRRSNASQGVTGALLYRDGTFMQILEGEESTVRGLYRTICADPRHQDVTHITQGVTDHRQFERWSMAFSRLDGEPSRFAQDYNSFFTSAPPGPTRRHDVARRLLSTFRATLD